MSKENFGNKKIAVVGSSGFVGTYLTNLLRSNGFDVIPMVRKLTSGSQAPSTIEIGDVLSGQKYEGVFEGITTVVYTVARTHRRNEEGPDYKETYNEINCGAMIRVAEAGYRQGVKRFIFLSSLKVLGEQSPPDDPFYHDSVPQPLGSYGSSKLLAENELIKLGRSTGLEVVIIRPPLIHGPGVKGNLDSLLRAVKLRIPLPLKLLSLNRRSLVSLENLCDLIKECIINPAAKNQVFMVKDQFDRSTVDIVKMLANDFGVKPILFPLPSFILHLVFFLIGKSAMLQRLVSDLRVNDDHTRNTLGWSPKSPKDKFEQKYESSQ